MKRLFIFFLLAQVCLLTFAQTVTLTFTGRDSVQQYVQLNRVEVSNATRDWNVTLNWPDTVLTMENGTGIRENGDIQALSLLLLQNNPTRSMESRMFI